MDLIECLVSSLERCLQKIFQLPFVVQSFTELCQEVQQNNVRDKLKDFITLIIYC